MVNVSELGVQKLVFRHALSFESGKALARSGVDSFGTVDWEMSFWAVDAASLSTLEVVHVSCFNICHMMPPRFPFWIEITCAKPAATITL